LLLLVAVGGAIGTGLREALSLIFPPVSGVALTTGVINVVGALVLGLLLTILSGHGDDTGRRRDVRLFAGTGILGGFTTYSALAVDTVLLGDAGRILAAGGYALGTLLLGLAAASLGVGIGRRIGGNTGTDGPAAGVAP
jgi:CrcB protein